MAQARQVRRSCRRRAAHRRSFRHRDDIARSDNWFGFLRGLACVVMAARSGNQPEHAGAYREHQQNRHHQPGVRRLPKQRLGFASIALILLRQGFAFICVRIGESAGLGRMGFYEPAGANGSVARLPALLKGWDRITRRKRRSDRLRSRADRGPGTGHTAMPPIPVAQAAAAAER